MFNQTLHEHKEHFCMHCLQCFSSEDVLKMHKENCIVINGEQAIKMPQKGEKIMLQNHQRQVPVLFIILCRL